MFCVNPEQTLFNDVDPATASKYMAAIQHQPASGWDDTITYAGWTKIPSTYLICENDACVPPPMQRQMAEAAKCKVVTCNNGHMVVVGSPEVVVDVIIAAVKK